MSDQNFETALSYTLEFEGLYSNDPADPGGSTMEGITQVEYTLYLDSKGLPHQPVRQIPMEDVRAIYKQNYWDACKCDSIAWPASCALFDFAVNSGRSRAVIELQNILKVSADGVVGNDTISHAALWNANNLTSAIMHARSAFLQELVAKRPILKKFENGWLTRVASLSRKLGLFDDVA